MNNGEKIAIIEYSIKTFGWFHFGKKEFECNGLHEESLDFYKENSTIIEFIEIMLYVERMLNPVRKSLRF
jgi:hypothetical protein